MTRKLTEEEMIREARNAYHREYRRKNRERILENERKWRKENPEKVAEINRNYWLRKAQKKEASN